MFSQLREIPSYKVHQTSIPIVIDGKIDDPVWTKADLINDFVTNSDNSPCLFKTEAKILYDNHFLYFAFHIFDDNIWSTKTERDDHLWEEEVIEIFIRADPKELSYIEIEVNPLGAVFDAYMLDSIKYLPFDSWNKKDLKWAVQVQGTIDGKPGDDSWTCEIAFPVFNAVTAPALPPAAGNIWYINLYRAELKPNCALISWSPTYRNDFHMPSYFGKLIFTGNKVP